MTLQSLGHSHCSPSECQGRRCSNKYILFSSSGLFLSLLSFRPSTLHNTLQEKRGNSVSNYMTHNTVSMPTCTVLYNPKSNKTAVRIYPAHWTSRTDNFLPFKHNYNQQVTVCNTIRKKSESHQQVIHIIH